jgi:DNA-binding CsgD family transcriptional regulator
MGISAQTPGVLALGVSAIHRSRTVEELQRACVAVSREVIHADAVGIYLLNEQLQPTAIYSHGVMNGFLPEYEKFRACDPLFRHVVSTNRFTHSMDLFDRRSWFDQPLHSFLSRWGLHYSIEAPLSFNGTVRGTLNLARCGTEYFSHFSIEMSRFLCSEVNAAFQRICELQTLRAELESTRLPADMPAMNTRASEVMRAAASGLTNREIASRLGVSENTVRTHLKQIYRRLGVHTRAQLARRIYSPGH